MNPFLKMLMLLAPEDPPPAGGTPPPAADPPPPAADPKKDPPPPAADPAKKESAKKDPPPAKKSVLKAAAEPAKKDPPAAEPKKDPPADDAPYEVKVPEGVKVEKAQLDEFTGWAKEKGLTPAQASEAVAFYAKQQEANATAWARQGDDWYGALEKDQEFGGANLKASEVALQKALKKFDPKGELVADLEKFGVDNLPSLAKFLRRVGLADAEDGTKPPPRLDTPKVSTEEARMAKRYPSLAQGEAKK